MEKRTVDPRPGQRLREVRQHREISPAKLAKAIGVSVGTIQHYEHGRVHITAERLLELAAALQCEPADLLMPPDFPLPRYRASSPGELSPNAGARARTIADREFVKEQ